MSTVYIKGLPEERFWPKVDRSGECWLWMAATTRPGGYGVFSNGRGVSVGAHVWSWESWNDAVVPDGFDVDHLCRTPGCVNPHHLRVIPASRNRAFQGPRLPVACRRGHPWTEHSEHRRPNGQRTCRICSTEGQRRYRTKAGQ